MTTTKTSLKPLTESNHPHQVGRQNAYELQRIFNRISSTPSGANCERSRRTGSEGVELRKTYSSKGVRASWSKQRCGSRLCPLCSPIRAFQDRRRLSLAVQEHTRQGGTSLFLTFTARTTTSTTPKFTDAEYAFRRDKEAFSAFRNADRGLPTRGAKARLREAAEAYGKAHGIFSDNHEQWELNRRLNDFRTTLSRSVFGKKQWDIESHKFNIVGRVDAVELVPSPAVAQDGTHDWSRVAHNLHIHAVVFVRGHLSEKQREALSTALIQRWTASISRRGYIAVQEAQDAQWVAGNDVANVIRYITKFSDEVVLGKSDPSKLSVWDALLESVEHVNEQGVIVPANLTARTWFRMVEQVFQGRRLVNTSIGFFKKMGVADLIAEQEAEWKRTAITEAVLLLTGDTWVLINEENPALKYELLNLAENTNADEFFNEMAKTGYEFVIPSTTTLTLDDLPDDIPIAA